MPFSGLPEHIRDVIQRAAIIAAGAGLFIKTFVQFWNTNRGAWGQAFKGNSKLLPLLTELRFKYSDVYWVAVLYCTNGGGEPKPGGPIFSHMLIDSHPEDKESFVSRWQDVRVDPHTNKMLLDVNTKGIFCVADVETLPDGVVKDASLANDIYSFDMHFVKATKTKWFYMVVSHSKKNVVSTPKYREDVRVLVTDLRNIIKR